MRPLWSETGTGMRRLACWLYLVCLRNGWSIWARPYNALLTAYRGYRWGETWWSLPDHDDRDDTQEA